MTYTVKLKDDHIRLGQALKAAGVAGSGVEAKFLIKDGKSMERRNIREERSFMTKIWSNAMERPFRS